MVVGVFGVEVVVGGVDVGVDVGVLIGVEVGVEVGVWGVEVGVDGVDVEVGVDEAITHAPSTQLVPVGQLNTFWYSFLLITLQKFSTNCAPLHLSVKL